MLAIEAADNAEVSCVILPLRGYQVVVPAVCIAEVLPWRPLRPIEGGPRWCPGALTWHGESVAVVDHEALESAGKGAEPLPGRCLAVINRTTPGGARAFYALAVNGIPRLVQLAQMDVAAEHSPETPAELLRVMVGTELLVIPDLASLERQVAELPTERAR